MGRLELILGFRGCRREMDMEAENTISIALRVLTKSNKNRYDSYCLKAVPLFETVKGQCEAGKRDAGSVIYKECLYQLPIITIILVSDCKADFLMKRSL